MFKSFFFILLSFLFIQFSFGNDTLKNYKIGVLSLTTKEKTIKKWEETGNYLSTKIKNSTFSITPMTYDEINLAMKKAEIDFLLTNPAHYIIHEKELSLFRLATVIYSKKDYDISSFGGVIVALKENNKINTIHDIVNKKIAAVKKGSLGGYQSQIKEILDNNLPLPDKYNVIFTDMPHRNTLNLLLDKKVDVAFLRSSVIENLKEKNEIDINKFKIINQKHKEYPFYVSTKLYPEWPFSALSHIDNELKKTVAETLFNIEQTSYAAIEGNYKGWYIPLDYNVVTELLQELRLPPFDKISNFTIKDIVEKYIEFFIVFIILTILLTLYFAKEKKQYEIIYKDNKSLLEIVAIENNLKDVLDKIVSLSEKRNSKTMCSILLLDNTKKHLRNGSAPSLPDFYNDAIDGLEIGEKVGSCGSAAFKKQRVIVKNINTHENWQPFLELTQKANLHSCWSQPILSSKNELLGTFAIYNKVPKRPSKFELKLIESYANIASKAIEKYQYAKEINENQEIMFHQSKIASLGEMLGNIAHQWRQPLSLITMASTGAKIQKEMGSLSDEQFNKAMDTINNTAQYLSQTIDDFRNFFLSDTSIEAEIDVKDVIEKVLSLVRDSYKSSNIEIIKNYQDTSMLVTCNENLFIQALINIFNNAKDALTSIKNMDEKLVFINLDNINNQIFIEIKDNANGIPEDIINKIFDPYFTTKHQSQGTGIGLYMTNQIITKHLKSNIIVENINYSYLNKEYIGACFTIKIN